MHSPIKKRVSKYFLCNLMRPDIKVCSQENNFWMSLVQWQGMGILLNSKEPLSDRTVTDSFSQQVAVSTWNKFTVCLCLVTVLSKGAPVPLLPSVK